MPVEQKDKRPLKAKLLEYRKQKKQVAQEELKHEQQQTAQLNQNQPNSPPSTTATGQWPRPSPPESRQEQGPRAGWQSPNYGQASGEAQPTALPPAPPTSRSVPVANALIAPPWRCVLDNFFPADLLDNYPMRKWREFCAAHPFRCWLLTGLFWAIGQLLAAKAEFGFVFLALFLLLLLLLNLGNRKEGELSAYSVFNPNYERLLGELTAEDFEREVLMRRKRAAAE